MCITPTASIGAGLEALRRGYKASISALPEDVRERLEAEGLTGSVRIDFEVPPAPRCHLVQRSHPLVSVLADTLLERTLAAAGDTANDPGVLGRVGGWISSATQVRTTVALLRLRHQLVTRRAGNTSTLLVEEATGFAWTGAASPTLVEGAGALALLVPPPTGDPPAHVRARAGAQALEQLATRLTDLDACAERRAQVLLTDHRRVREAADARGSYTVKALLPADVIGLFVLLPKVD